MCGQDRPAVGTPYFTLAARKTKPLLGRCACGFNAQPLVGTMKELEQQGKQQEHCVGFPCACGAAHSSQQFAPA